MAVKILKIGSSNAEFSLRVKIHRGKKKTQGGGLRGGQRVAGRAHKKDRSHSKIGERLTHSPGLEGGTPNCIEHSMACGGVRGITRSRVGSKLVPLVGNPSKRQRATENLSAAATLGEKGPDSQCRGRTV